jgi:hypothetical protein
MIGARFTCNICGTPGVFDPPDDWREGASCAGCGSSVRMRSIVHCLLSGLLGQSCVLEKMPRKRLIGAGLSDWEGYASRLAKAFDYTNTFYHQAPRFDICAPGPERLGLYDFLISSDVFEHTPAPASRAFDGAFEFLRPGGLLVMTVPFGWQEETIEHYPDLGDFTVVELGGDYALVSRETDGKFVLYENPVFHGGPGTTLEMREFSLDGLMAELEAAGFTEITLHADAVPEWGIFPRNRYGVPVTARKPAGALDRLKFKVRKARPS